VGGVLVNPPGTTFFNFYRPDQGTDGPLDTGAFASSPTNINSTYDFRAFDEAGAPVRPGTTPGLHITRKAAQPFARGPRDHTLYGITEIMGGGAAALDDQHHIEMLTNGYITLKEKTDDLRVGSITSTGSPSAAEPHSGDVTLFSPAAIIDAQNDGPGAEVIAG